MPTDNETLLIVDDNRLFREGLSRILSHKRFGVHREVCSFAEALILLQDEDLASDLLVGDLVPEQPDEVEAMKTILDLFPKVKVVILTDRISPAWSEILLEQGVFGFLSKNISGEALRHSLDLVLMGEQIIPTFVRRAVAGALPAPETVAPAAPSAVALSGRENQILKCLVNGLPNKLIARELNMAEATVKVHLKALLRKLNVQNRTQAAIWAMTNAPVSPPPKAWDAPPTGRTAAPSPQSEPDGTPPASDRRLQGLRATDSAAYRNGRSDPDADQEPAATNGATPAFQQ